MDTPECSICQEPIFPIDEAHLECGHKFHKKCLAIWARDPNKTCPMCRAPIEIKYNPNMIRRDKRGGRKTKRTKTRRTKTRRTKTKRTKTRIKNRKSMKKRIN